MELITQDILAPRARYLGRKGIYPVIEDFDDLFRRLDTTPVLANEIDLDTVEGQEKFNQLVYSRYDGDVFSNVPSCPCRFIKGGHRISEYCPKCGFQCLPITEQAVEPIVWVRAPKGVPAFMQLNIYRVLKILFTKSGFSTIDYLLDPRYRPPKLICDEQAFIDDQGWERGLNYFHANFFAIMEKLCSTRLFIRVQAGRECLDFLYDHKHLIFCQHIPFPSKIGFILEDVGERMYADPKMAPALDALIAIANAGKVGRTTQKDIESRVARSMNKLSDYYDSSERGKLFDKKGIFRKLVYGESPHWSFRTVITSMHKPHDHESLSIPWGAGVMTFKMHLENKLLREDYTPNEILTLIYDNVLRHHPKIEKLFSELIAESPGGRGMPCVFTRFPSLKRASSQRFFIDHIKKDPTQLSTSISVLCLKGPNADFDGDYMTGQLALDNWTARAYERLAPYTGIMDLRTPFRVGDHAAIPTPVLSTINSRLEEGDDESVTVEE